MSSFCSFLSPLVCPSCILLVYLWAFPGFFFDEYILPFTKKKKSHPSIKRLDDLINSWRNSLDKRGLGFIDESTTPSSSKTTFVKPSEDMSSDKTDPKLKFQCTYSTKMGYNL